MKKLLITTFILSLFFILGNTIIAQNSYTSMSCPCEGDVMPSQEQIQQQFDEYQPRIGKSNLTMPAGFMAGSSRSMLDSRGTDFWLAFLQNYRTYGTLYLDITSEVNASGTVTIAGISFSQPFTVTANTVTRVSLPQSAIITSSNTVQSLGIHVISDQEVTVYGMNQQTSTTDGYLGLPVDILGTSYLVMTYPGLGGSNTSPEYGIVSPYDNNLITITPSDLTANGNPAGVPFNITLNQGQTFMVKGRYATGYSADQTGSVITSTLPIAVFSGTGCANIPVGYGACDHLVEQIPPVSSWGTTFVTKPLESRLNGDTWRFLASQNGTQLTINGSNVATLNFGDHFETMLTTESYVEATHPILAVQFSNGQNWDGVLADPFMMIIPPYQQYLTTYNFSTPQSGFTGNYFSSAVETTGVSGMRINGAPLNPAAYSAIGATGYSAAGFPVSINTSYNITNTGGVPSGLYLYGFGSYDSYGYPGGLSLISINPGSGPVITLTPVTLGLFCTSLPSGLAVDISALITDPDPPLIQSAVLFYRTVGSPTYTSLAMTMGGGNIWSATIPGVDVSGPGIEFYVYATDGQVITTSPDIDPVNNPYSLGVDNLPPQITHTPVTSADVGLDVPIVADVVDNTNSVQSVELLYRITGGTPFYTVLPMSLVVGDTYAATIPGAQMTSQGIDYYIRATDNFGVSCSYGSGDDPMFIQPGTTPPTSVPLSDWAIYIAVFLIGIAIWYRFKTRIA